MKERMKEKEESFDTEMLQKHTNSGHLRPICAPLISYRYFSEITSWQKHLEW